MNAYEISINRLVVFNNATAAVKKRIIREQIVPFKPKISWYRLAKGRIKKFFQLNCDPNQIISGIQDLKMKKYNNPQQIMDKEASIEGLRRFMKIKLPSILKEIEYEVVNAKEKSLELSNVNIVVAPDIILRGTYKGKIVLGGIKMHMVKNDSFDLQQCQDVASIIHQYLKKKIASKNEKVLPHLCFCLDVFSDRLVPAPLRSQRVLKRVEKVCDEVRKLWERIVTIEVKDMSSEDPNFKVLNGLSIDKQYKLVSGEKPKKDHILRFWPANFAEASFLLSKQGIKYQILSD